MGKQTETQSQSYEGTFYCRANAHAPAITPPPPNKNPHFVLLIENPLSHEAFYGDCKFTQLGIILSLLF